MPDSPPFSSPLPNVIDIADVARRTGISSRALRFYEARGLLRPLRSASGRRLYGPGELAAVHRILTLKRAGLTLAQIQRLSSGRPVDLGALIAAQIDVLAAQAEEIAAAQAVLRTVKSRIDRSEPIDVATLCSLIRQGDMIMTRQQWDAVTDRYFTPEEKDSFAQQMQKVPGDFDQARYAADWADLGGRIKAALPLDPASDEGQAFLREWSALLAPFTAVATPEMMAGVQTMYERMDEWEGQADPGFDKSVFDFIKAAQKAGRTDDHG